MEKKKQNIWLLIMAVLILAEIITGIMTMTNDYLFINIIKMFHLVLIALYGFWLYKKPHGNMLKYAMIILAATQILSAIMFIKLGADGMNLHTIRIFASAIIVYVAGRLDRIEQNKRLLCIATFILFASAFVQTFLAFNKISPLYLFTWFSGAISSITLMIAYFVRYKEHKEAGISDK